MNPDGYEAGTRGNSQGVDLNRSFPDRIADPHPAPAARQPEVRAVMELFEEHSFALAANYHTGAVLVNYPWDSNPNYESVFTPTPDEDWYVELAHAYADNNPMMAGSTEFPGGITNGAAWYAIYGGLQDYSVAFHGTPHVTLELAEDHDVPHEQIPQYWADNEESMLAYLEMGLQGVRGVVTDASTGEPLAASVRVDHNPTEAFSDPDMGDYYRLLLPDTYVLYISSPGYQTRRIFDVEVTSGNYTRVDAALAPADSIYWASDGAEATRFHSEPVTGLDAWHTTAEDAWGDGLSWKCGATDSTTYPAGLDGAIVSEVVTVRPNTRLSFLHRIAAETEEDHYPQAWDGGVVEIRPEGQEQWHPLAPETGYPYTARNPDGGGPLPQGRGLFSGHEMWRESSCLLTGWEGPARIRFRFVSDGSVGYEGWYVDAVTLREVDLPALALADSFALPPTPLGETSTGQLQVRNTGSDWLELLAVTSSPPTVFHATLPEEARWVAPGDSVPVPVLFIPWEPGEVAGELELATTADTATVALLGTGTEDAGVEPGSGALPRELTLAPPWPNPFNSSASIRFGLPVATGAKLTIYDVLGRQVVRLVEGRRRPGWHLVHWDGRSEGGQPSASGTYIAVLEAGGHRAIRSFRLLR
jgi:hypothetical protein